MYKLVYINVNRRADDKWNDQILKLVPGIYCHSHMFIFLYLKCNKYEQNGAYSKYNFYVFT